MDFLTCNTVPTFLRPNLHETPKKSKIMTHLINLQPPSKPSSSENLLRIHKKKPTPAPTSVLFPDLPLFWSYYFRCFFSSVEQKPLPSNTGQSQSLSITIITPDDDDVARQKHQNRILDRAFQPAEPPSHNLQSSSLSLSSTAAQSAKVQKVLSQNVNYFIYVFNRLIDSPGSSPPIALFGLSPKPRHP